MRSNNVLFFVIPSPSRLWREREGSRVSVILNLFQDPSFRVKPGMTRALGMTTVLFTIILTGLAACDSGGGSDGDDPCNAPKGDRPSWCEQNADATDNTGTDTDEQGYCGDGVCNANENCNCDLDCPCADGEVCTNGVCGEDPLKDYYWLGGQWEREEDGYIVDVEITGWDNEKGAKIDGFSPCGQGWAIKDNNPNQLFFSGQSEMVGFQCSDGKIDVINKINSFTAISTTESISCTYIQQ